MSVRPIVAAAAISPLLLASGLASGGNDPGMSRALMQGLRRYETADYHQASALLHKVASRGTADGEKNRQRAEFWLGKTFYHLGYYVAALSTLDSIAQKPSHSYRTATVKWLLSLGRKLPDPAGVPRRLGKHYNADLLKAPELARLRDEIRYALGRYKYDTGSFKEAAALLHAVKPQSGLYLKARFLEGVLHVRRYKARPAAAALKDVLLAARRPPVTAEKRKLAELATLNLGRLFYSTRQYRKASEYYEKITRASPRWADAQFELSWARFQQDALAPALDSLRAARSAGTGHYPESHLLEAVIYHQSCRYVRSRQVARRFAKRYAPLREKLIALQNRHRDPSAFFDLAGKIRERSAGLKGDLATLARSALADRLLGKSFDWVREIDRERKMLQAAPASWRSNAVAGVVLQELTLQGSLARNEAGQLARHRIGRLASELQGLLQQAGKVVQDSKSQLRRGPTPACKKLGRN